MGLVKDNHVLCFNSTMRTCSDACENKAISVLHTPTAPTPYKPLCHECLSKFKVALSNLQQKHTKPQPGEDAGITELRAGLLAKPYDEISLDEWLRGLPIREVMDP